ncbi:MAG: hypothetical protein KBF62_01335 [Candidatus Pacebacteria bacterium]|nr:hypothetical protein [Candidatus Paceibacterota bacterium]MBP9058263.1 hypothetical protein [Candidatus Paceibacterota bacterium]MBP9770502.1 hypothetical protein [Candidatus Paceibacterota bacterium]
MIYKIFFFLISVLSFGLTSPVLAADVEVSGLWISNITDTTVTVTVDIINNKNLPSAYDVTLAYKIEDATGDLDETPDIVSGTIPPGESTLPVVVINSLEPGEVYYIEALNHTVIGGAVFSETLKSTSFETLEESTDTNNLDTGEITTTTTGGVECVETDGSYCLLEPIPEFGNKITPETGFGEYVNTLIRLILGVVGVIVVITFVYGGIMWMGTDSIFKKTDAKQRMEDAALGTLLLIGAYIILNTINPNLVDIKIYIPSSFTTLKVEEITDSGEVLTIEYSTEAGECPKDCSKLNGETGTDVPYESTGDSVASGLKSDLQVLTQKLSGAGISWTTTEAWEPSRTHKAHCHSVGTCIDANFRGLADNSNPPPEKVKSFIESGLSIGLCPIYEVETESQRNAVINAGVDPKYVKNYGGWISAPHFSVYGGSCS